MHEVYSISSYVAIKYMVLATPTECVKTMGLVLLCQPFAWVPAISLSCMELLPVFFVFTILCGKVIVY